jgi:hypothetical protein
MKTKIKYTDEPLGKLKVVPDFLPSPEELAFREDSVKVTIVDAEQKALTSRLTRRTKKLHTS